MSKLRTRHLPAVFVALTVACLSLGILCAQPADAHTFTLARRLVLLGTGLLVAGVLVLTVHAFRTVRYVSCLHRLSAVAFSDPIRSLVHEIGFDSQHMVLIAAQQPQVFCYGFVKPRICLSTGLVEQLSPAQLRAVLLHEDYHRRHFHPLRILLLDALAMVLFLLPVVGDWCKLQKIKLELAADRYAVDLAGKPVLAGALHRLLLHHTEPVPNGVVGLSINRARVARLLGEHEPSPFSARNLVISAATLLGLCVLVL